MLSNLSSWAAQPFSESMDIWQWLIFLAIAISFAVLWLQVLHHIGV